MIALLIIIGLLLVAAIFAVGFVVAFIVAVVKHRNGSLTKEDLDKSSAYCKNLREKRRKQWDDDCRAMDRFLYG